MRYTLADPVRLLSGVGPKVADNLGRMGIQTMGDLLHWFPRRYLDGSQPVPIAQAPLKQLVTLSVEVLHVDEGRTRNRNLKVTKIQCGDDSGTITAQWFNQPYIKTKLIPGSRWILIGEIKWFGGERVLANPQVESRPVILPIYPQTSGVTSRMLRGYVRQALNEVAVEEMLPETVRIQSNLLRYQGALERLHQPVSMDDISTARHTLAFAEVWDFFVRMEQGQAERVQEAGIALPIDLPYLKQVVGELPFTLTPGQKQVIWEMVQEMATGQAMTRLLNGDVGSGKTVVAGILAVLAAHHGYRTAFLAPTEILAEQHYATLRQLFVALPVTIGLWTGAVKNDEGGRADILVGTHALLSDKIEIEKLGLIIIDEQHRFGVRQRGLLREGKQAPPHLLSMTATPIPRTLALTLFADLRVSFLRGLPAGRLPVVTRVVRSTVERDGMHRQIMAELSVGRQVFVVCPAITAAEPEPGSVSEEAISLFDSAQWERTAQKAVEAEAERLRRDHPEYGTVAVLHGKLKSREKQAVMAAVHRKEVQVLVATTVVEVGVDVPNATVLVVEGAEHFGLAQLHQLRGRVGRGGNQGYCYLCPSGAGGVARLAVLAETTDGFAVAEADLADRGPGDLQGTAQAGLPDFRLAQLSDVPFLQEVRAALQSFLSENSSYLREYTGAGYSKVVHRLE